MASGAVGGVGISGLVEVEPQTAGRVVPLVGANPPWNQPQVMSALFSKTPMLMLPSVTVACLEAVEQSSSPGSMSPISTPLSAAPAMVPFVEEVPVTVRPEVVPAARLSAPTDE